jgi:hypothetical protein
LSSACRSRPGRETRAQSVVETASRHRQRQRYGCGRLRWDARREGGLGVKPQPASAGDWRGDMHADAGCWMLDARCNIAWCRLGWQVWARYLRVGVVQEEEEGEKEEEERVRERESERLGAGTLLRESSKVRQAGKQVGKRKAGRVRVTTKT